MNPAYQEHIDRVSQQLADIFLKQEQDLARRASLLDADIAECVRQIGRQTTQLVLEHTRDALVNQAQANGLTIQRAPSITFNVIFGPIELQSPYLWAKGQHTKPLIDDMGITHHGRSDTVNRALSDFGSEESFEQAATRFNEHYKYELHSSTASRVTKEVAHEAQTYLEEWLSPVSMTGDRLGQGPATVETLLIEVDGCDLRTATLEEIPDSTDTTPVYHNPKKQKEIHWREVRLGLSRALDSTTKRYVGTMGTYVEVMEPLFQVSVLQGMGPETTVVGVADGAIGLKEAMEQQFPTMQFILDKPHLKDHLYDTAEAIGIRRDERSDWVQSRLEAVSQGQVAQVTQELEDAYEQTPHQRLKRLIGYLTRFSQALNYEEFTANGYPIGSGEIESAHRSIPQKRLKLPGACWHPDSINPMLSLRILRANELWDDFWEARTQRKMVA